MIAFRGPRGHNLSPPLDETVQFNRDFSTIRETSVAHRLRNSRRLVSWGGGFAPGKPFARASDGTPARGGDSGGYRILCLGESTTAPWLGPRDGSWPRQLEEVLKKKDPLRKYEVVNVGFISTNSGLILARLPGFVRRYHPDLVISMMGVNDSAWYGIVEPELGWKGRLTAAVRGFRLWRLGRFLAESLHRSKPDDPQTRKAPPDVDRCMRYLDAQFSDYGNLPPGAESDCLLASNRHPENPWPYSALFIISKDVARSRNMEKEAIAHGGMIGHPVGVLAWYYQQQGDSLDLERLYRMIKGRDDGVYTTLTELAWHAGDRAGALRNFERGVENAGEFPRDFSVTGYDELPAASTASVTAVNYRRMAAYLRTRKIPLIAMQYPRLDLRKLKSILEPDSGVTFVGNDSNFERALAHGAYGDYFADDFGWFPGGPRWGHCTTAGNRLIAENVAEAVVRLHSDPSGQ
jgi:GDSL-like lipase/acylhydrolase family protein